MSNGIGRSKENLPTDANHVARRIVRIKNAWQSKTTRA